KHIKSYPKWHTRLPKLDFNRDLSTRGNLGKPDFLFLHRDIAFTVEDATQSVAPQSVHWHIAPRSDEQAKRIQLVFNRQRCNRTRFEPQDFVGGFRPAIDIHHAMNALFQRPDAAIANMGPIVV